VIEMNTGSDMGVWFSLLFPPDHFLSACTIGPYCDLNMFPQFP
jgi:hypothetical protein